LVFLKFFLGLSPAEDLATRTMSVLSVVRKIPGFVILSASEDSLRAQGADDAVDSAGAVIPQVLWERVRTCPGLDPG